MELVLPPTTPSYHSVVFGECAPRANCLPGPADGLSASTENPERGERRCLGKTPANRLAKANLNTRVPTHQS